MHAALSNGDVVYTILHQLAGTRGEISSTAISDPIPKHQRSLLNVGLTCQALLEPALDRLWSSVESLVPLVSILPAITNDGRADNSFNVVKDSHWGRLKYYGARTRYFTSSGRILSKEACAQLSCLRRGPLLPNLREFRCHLASGISISEVAVVLDSPSIERFTLTWGDNYSRSDVFHDQIILLLPQSQSKAIGTLDIDTTVTHLNLVTEFTALRSFSTTTPINRIHLDSLIQITTLRKLVITLASPSANSAQQEYSGIPWGIFPKLEIANIEGPGSSIYALLQRFGAPSLSYLRIRSTSNDSHDVWDSIAYLIQKKWRGKVKQLSLIPYHDSWGNFVSLPPAVLNVGSDFGIDSLKLEGWGSIGIAEISQLSTSFKSLRSLYLTSPQGNISWDILGPIQRGFPVLEHLSISMNSHDHSELVATPDCEPSSTHPLRYLYISGLGNNLSLNQTLKISLRLDNLFPKVELRSPSQTEEQFVVDLRSLLATFRRIRQDEKKKLKCTKCTSFVQSSPRTIY